MKLPLITALLLAFLPPLSAFGVIPVKIGQRVSVQTTALHQSSPRQEEDIIKTDSNAAAADRIAKQTNKILESNDPSTIVDAAGTTQEEEEEEDDEEEFQDQIFDPNMFWTERSGRFPRNK